MRALLQNPLWHQATRVRLWQQLVGRISGFLLTIALIALFDGLLAEMRSGHQQLNLLPGETVTVSGPVALKNPLHSDLVARFAPDSSSLRFQLEGFFTGYWFGSGMWRGQIEAAPDAEPGRFFLRISFRGASVQNAQQYELNVYANAHAMQAASLSFICRFTGINPFLLAVYCGVCGIILGIVTYCFGRQFTRLLHTLGLVQIYSHNTADAVIHCLVPKDMAPPPGNDRMILTGDGTVVGEARVISWQKGKLKLKLLEQSAPPPNGLVCLKHPRDPEKQQKLKNGIFISIE